MLYIAYYAIFLVKNLLKPYYLGFLLLVLVRVVFPFLLWDLFKIESFLFLVLLFLLFLLFILFLPPFLLLICAPRVSNLKREERAFLIHEYYNDAKAAIWYQSRFIACSVSVCPLYPLILVAYFLQETFLHLGECQQQQRNKIRS